MAPCISTDSRPAGSIAASCAPALAPSGGDGTEREERVAPRADAVAALAYRPRGEAGVREGVGRARRALRNGGAHRRHAVARGGRHDGQQGDVGATHGRAVGRETAQVEPVRREVEEVHGAAGRAHGGREGGGHHAGERALDARGKVEAHQVRDAPAFGGIDERAAVGRERRVVPLGAVGRRDLIHGTAVRVEECEAPAAGALHAGDDAQPVGRPARARPRHPGRTVRERGHRAAPKVEADEVAASAGAAHAGGGSAVGGRVRVAHGGAARRARDAARARVPHVQVGAHHVVGREVGARHQHPASVGEEAGLAVRRAIRGEQHGGRRARPRERANGGNVLGVAAAEAAPGARVGGIRGRVARRVGSDAPHHHREGAAAAGELDRQAAPIARQGRVARRVLSRWSRVPSTRPAESSRARRANASAVSCAGRTAVERCRTLAVDAAKAASNGRFTRADVRRQSAVIDESPARPPSHSRYADPIR
jgi:hypothetical protein